MSGQPKRVLTNRRRRNPSCCGRQFVMQCSNKWPVCRQSRQISPHADGDRRRKAGEGAGPKTVSKQKLVTKRLVNATPATVRSRFENFLRSRTRFQAVPSAFYRPVERRPTDRRPLPPDTRPGAGGSLRTRAHDGAGSKAPAGSPARQGFDISGRSRAAPPGFQHSRFEDPRLAEGTGRPAGKQRFREKQPPRCEPGP